MTVITPSLMVSLSEEMRRLSDSKCVAKLPEPSGALFRIGQGFPRCDWSTKLCHLDAFESGGN